MKSGKAKSVIRESVNSAPVVGGTKMGGFSKAVRDGLHRKDHHPCSVQATGGVVSGWNGGKDAKRL